MTFGRSEWLWLLAAVPVSAALAAWLWRRRFDALAAWASRALWPRLELEARRGQLWLSVAALSLAIFGVIGALAEPRWGTIEETVEREGVDVVFVLDSSLSMAADDVAPDRLTVAASLVRELARRLPGHRVALVQAEGDGVVLAPLTIDAAVLDLLLDTILPASLPTPGTLLERSLGQAVRLFPEEGPQHRVIVLLSDGEDHSDADDRIAATLEESGAVLFALGVGSPQGAPIRLPGSDAYKEDEEGNVVVSKLNEDLMARLAHETGGLYLRAAGLGVDLDPVVGAINDMERRSIDGQVTSTLAQRFQWPLAAGLVALLMHLVAMPLAPSRAESERLSS